MSERPDADTLETLYWDEGLSLAGIAEEYDVSKQTVSNWLKKHDIQTRSSKYDRPDEGTLEEWHHDEELTIKQMAKRIECSYDTMRRWLHEADVEIIRANKKREWEPCADCGTEGGSKTNKNGQTPTRIDGEQFGFDGKLCRTCYIKHWRRREREKGKDPDGTPDAVEDR